MTVWVWLGFIVFLLGMLALDLGVFHRKVRTVGIREALAWTVFWVALALAFNAAVYELYEKHWFGIGLTIGQELTGKDAALQFFTGYVIEKSLSLDNVFVIALIFSYFAVPMVLQHRVLFWGILGALVMRGLMIVAGVALINRFDWLVYVFGAILLATAVKILIVRHDNLEPNKNPLVRLARRWFAVSPTFDGERFFTTLHGARAITPLFLVLLVIESSDLLFAVDSIPAIFAVTKDPFLVFTSNVFAILGLRSLYFALAGMMDHFQYLKSSLVFVLAFVGVKMMLTHHYPISTGASLAVIGGILLVGVLASLFGAQRDTAPLVSPLADQLQELARLTWSQARRVVTITIGTTVLLVGVALLVLPGPAFVVIPLGLAILGTEFVWARRALRKLKDAGGYLASGVGLGNKPKEAKDP